jgi:crossover junction endodeoxyribonuclease RuvC
MRVLGVDPGLEATGYGVIERTDTGDVRLLEAGVIRTETRIPLAERLVTISREIRQVIADLRPAVLVLEELYSAYKHPRTAIVMGHARGVICLAAAEAGLPVVGYAPARIKQAVVGSGRASKDQVGRMVTLKLGLTQVPEPDDVTDALAVALTHCEMGRRLASVKVGEP